MNDGNDCAAVEVPENLGDSPYNNELGHPTQAARFDQGKVRLELLPTIFMYCVARVFTFGAKKYDDWNWSKGFPWLQPYASLMRHMVAWHRGEDLDEESGLPHLDHAACNLAMLITFREENIGEDNRKKWVKPEPEVVRTYGGEFFSEVFMRPSPELAPSWVRQQGFSTRVKTVAEARAEALRQDGYGHLPVRVVKTYTEKLSDGTERHGEALLLTAMPGDEPITPICDGDED